MVPSHSRNTPCRSISRPALPAAHCPVTARPAAPAHYVGWEGLGVAITLQTPEPSAAHSLWAEAKTNQGRPKGSETPELPPKMQLLRRRANPIFNNLLLAHRNRPEMGLCPKKIAKVSAKLGLLGCQQSVFMGPIITKQHKKERKERRKENTGL